MVSMYVLSIFMSTILVMPVFRIGFICMQTQKWMRCHLALELSTQIPDPQVDLNQPWSDDCVRGLVITCVQLWAHFWVAQRAGVWGEITLDLVRSAVAVAEQVSLVVDLTLIVDWWSVRLILLIVAVDQLWLPPHIGDNYTVFNDHQTGWLVYGCNLGSQVNLLYHQGLWVSVWSTDMYVPTILIASW